MSDEIPIVSPDPTRRKFLLNHGKQCGSKAWLRLPYRAREMANCWKKRLALDRKQGRPSRALSRITLRINGKDHQLRIDPRHTIRLVIRETVALDRNEEGL